MVTNSKPNAVVILSGGAARGLAHIGVLKEIEKNFEIKAIIGTSMGALVGGLYTAGLSPNEMLSAFKLDITDLLKFLKIGIKPEGVIDADKFRKKIEQYVGKTKIENCKINFTAISYDLTMRKSLLHNSGFFVDAIRASTALPVLLKPIKSGTHLLVDGGVEYPLPVEFAASFPDDYVRIVSSVYAPIPASPEVFEIKSSSEKISTKEVILSSLQSLMYNQAFLATKSITNNRVDLFINAYADNLKFWDFHEAKAFANIGEKAAYEALSFYCKNPKSRTTWLEELKDKINDITQRIEDYIL